MVYIGIDPGGNGAMAAVSGYDDVLFNVPFSRSGYIELLKSLNPQKSICTLEKVWAMPKQGVVSMFHFGENFGFCQGILSAFSIPFTLDTPQQWKNFYGISADKNESIELCNKLYPEQTLLKNERCKKPHDGMAEALLLARYTRMKQETGR